MFSFCWNGDSCGSTKSQSLGGQEGVRTVAVWLISLCVLSIVGGFAWAFSLKLVSCIFRSCSYFGRSSKYSSVLDLKDILEPNSCCSLRTLNSHSAIISYFWALKRRSLASSSNSSSRCSTMMRWAWSFASICLRMDPMELLDDKDLCDKDLYDLCDNWSSCLRSGCVLILLTV